MQPAKAKLLLGTLLAAFRPRDFGEPSEKLYLAALADFEYPEAEAAVRSIIRFTDFMPSLHGLIEAVIEKRDSMGLRPQLAVVEEWTAEDEVSAKEIIEKFYAEHKFYPPMKSLPKTPQAIDFDEEAAEKRRQAARRAARKLREKAE
jgi:hypothetical protein